MFLNEIEVQTEWRLNAPSVQHENFLLAKKLKLSAQKRFLFDNATWRFRQRAPLSLSLCFFFKQTSLSFCGTVLKVIHLVADNQGRLDHRLECFRIVIRQKNQLNSAGQPSGVRSKLSKVSDSTCRWLAC